MTNPPPDAWLLLRGLGRVRQHWHDFPDRFQSATGAAVITLDLAGVGDAGNEPVPWTIAGNVASLRRRWLAVRGDHRAWGVLAISLGGMIALDWAHRRPGDFTRVVALTASSSLSPPWKRLRPRAAALLARILATKDPRRREELVLQMTTIDPTRHRAAIDAAERINREHPVPARVWLRQLVAAMASRPRPTAAPTLLLASERDNMVHPDCSRTLADRLRLPLQLHSSCGHDLPLEEPAWLVDRVLQWSDEGPGRGSAAPG